MDFKSAVQGDPNRFVKLVVGLSSILLLLWLVTIYSTDDTSPSTYSPEEQARVDSLRSVLGFESSNNPDRPQNDGLMDNAFPAFIFLALLLAGVWYWNRKQTPLASAAKSFVHNVGEQSLGGNATLTVVKFQKEYWVLGVTPHQVTLLKTIPESEWDSSLPVTSTTTPTPKTFKDWLKSTPSTHEK